MRICTVSLLGNIATKRQTFALAEALLEKFKASTSAHILTLFPESPNGGVLTNNTTSTWRKILSVDEMKKINCGASGRLAAPWPDLVISCRPEVSAIALSIKEASGGCTKIVHIQNPNGASNAYNFDLNAFDLIVRQPHEKIEGPNVISSELALHGLNANVLGMFRAAGAEVLDRYPSPKMAVLVGGSDEHITFTNEMFEEFGSDLHRLAESYKGTIVVIPSRRTGQQNKDILVKHLAKSSNVVFDDSHYNAWLGGADQFIVTAESLSMVAEPAATDKPIILYDFNGRLSRHPLNSVFQGLAAKGRVGYFKSGMKQLVNPPSCEAYDELPKLSGEIYRRLELLTASRR